VLAGLIAVHLGWGLARLPTKAHARRVDEIESWRRLGPARFLLENEHRRGGTTVQWIVDHVPPDAAVLWRGESRGALEFVPALIAPRLLIAEDACPPGARTWRDRELARAPRGDGSEGVLVVVGESRDAVGLAVR
jgi:hypothetical protein